MLVGSTNDEKIWNFLLDKIKNPFGVAGLMGNLFAESSLKSNNLQGAYNTKLHMTDEEYTEAVDNGSYTNFVKDSAGYGLAQWTYYSRKQNLLDYAHKVNKSIGDLEMQLEFLYSEIQQYKTVFNTLLTTDNIPDASNIVLTRYERPKNQSDAVKAKRISYCTKYYDKFANKEEEKEEKSVGVRLVHSSLGETGKIINNKAGDQTGKEVLVRNWYNRPWDIMIRYDKDPSLGAKAAEIGVKLANSNLVGYDQYGRNSTYKALKKYGYDVDKYLASGEKTECDCASFVYACWACVVPSMRTDSNAPVTSNMRKRYTNWGFTIYSDSKYTHSMDYLLPGDLLVKEDAHTVMCCDINTPNTPVPGKDDPVPTPTPDPDPDPTPTPTPTPTPSGGEVRAKYSAKLKDTSLYGTYVTTSKLYCRNGAGKKYSSLCLIPKGHKVKCYGFYTEENNNKWLYIQFKLNGVKYTGFSMINWLEKV